MILGNAKNIFEEAGIKISDTVIERADRIGKGSLTLGVVVKATAQLHSTKPELRFYAGLKLARGVSETRGGEGLWQ